jgi:hypothetical protein
VNQGSSPPLEVQPTTLSVFVEQVWLFSQVHGCAVCRSCLAAASKTQSSGETYIQYRRTSRTSCHPTKSYRLVFSCSSTPASSAPPQRTALLSALASTHSHRRGLTPAFPSGALLLHTQAPAPMPSRRPRGGPTRPKATVETAFQSSVPSAGVCTLPGGTAVDRSPVARIMGRFKEPGRDWQWDGIG